MLERLLRRAQSDGEAIIVYHQTSADRARQIERQGFCLANAEMVEANCFGIRSTDTEQESRTGALITLRLPIAWLRETDFNLNPMWLGLEILADVPAEFIVHTEFFDRP
jgi:hypothetical protein